MAIRNPISVLWMMALPHPHDVSPPNLNGAFGCRFFYTGRQQTSRRRLKASSRKGDVEMLPAAGL